MARIKISFPEKNIYETSISVRINDVNYGNHLGHDSLVSILHESRVKWLTSLGYSEINIEGLGIILNELVVNYINESFYGDTLMIQIGVGEISTVGFELFYKVSTKKENQDMLVAIAKTGLVFYDYTNKKVAAVPGKFKNKLDQ
jgi:acyl-CoA thioesterase FadM